MVIEKRLPNLLSLLESHAGNATHKVPMVLRPPAPTPLPPKTNLVDKKMKRDKKARKGTGEEGEIQEDTPLEKTRGPKAIRSKQKRAREVIETVPKRHPRILRWNPPLVLDGAPPHFGFYYLRLL